MTIYGLVLTAAGLLMQSGVIASAASADQQALAWHAYLWDPWFCSGERLSPPPWYGPRQPGAVRIARGR